jgi:hypothetical protein
MSAQIPRQVFRFFGELARHHDRLWFEAEGWEPECFIAGARAYGHGPSGGRASKTSQLASAACVSKFRAAHQCRTRS